MGTDISGAVEKGLLHYTRRLRSGRVPVGIPTFLPDTTVSADSGDEYEVAVGPETRAALEREARRQQVALTQLATHAVLVYLADVDTIFGGEAVGVG